MSESVSRSVSTSLPSSSTADNLGTGFPPLAAGAVLAGGLAGPVDGVLTALPAFAALTGVAGLGGFAALTSLSAFAEGEAVLEPVLAGVLTRGWAGFLAFGAAPLGAGFAVFDAAALGAGVLAFGAAAALGDGLDFAVALTTGLAGRVSTTGFFFPLGDAAAGFFAVMRILR